MAARVGLKYIHLPHRTRTPEIAVAPAATEPMTGMVVCGT